MRWRDLRFEKPTKADECSGQIIQKLTSGRICFWPAEDLRACVAWMPLSELPEPDLPGPIPDGWRPASHATDNRMEAMYWDHLNQKWVLVTSDIGGWSDDDCYIVPIDPPAPQYRPFANAAAFMPHADRWVKHKLQDFSSATVACTDSAVWLGSATIGTSYGDMCKDFTFADDGTPFGVLINS
jgi:hypothetical protein